jgi:hypothetical protein
MHEVRIPRFLRGLGQAGLDMLLGSSAWLAGASSALAEERAPNIVLMLSDNLGFGEIDAYGGGVLRGAPAPRLDQMAAEGLRLINFNVEVECTPSRSALMTGRGHREFMLRSWAASGKLISVRSGKARGTSPALGIRGYLRQARFGVADALSQRPASCGSRPVPKVGRPETRTILED